MARVTVYLPDELEAMVRAELPGLNVSATLRKTLESLLSCSHPRWRCVDCGSDVDQVAHDVHLVARFYGEVMIAVEPLVFRVGTAEGAAAAVHDVASAWGINVGPRPRPTRRERELAQWEARETA
jgi:hypothetical protein